MSKTSRTALCSGESNTKGHATHIQATWACFGGGFRGHIYSWNFEPWLMAIFDGDLWLSPYYTAWQSKLSRWVSMFRWIYYQYILVNCVVGCIVLMMSRSSLLASILHTVLITTNWFALGAEIPRKGLHDRLLLPGPSGLTSINTPPPLRSHFGSSCRLGSKSLWRTAQVCLVLTWIRFRRVA